MSACTWPSLGVRGPRGAACVAVVRLSASTAAAAMLPAGGFHPGIRQEMRAGAVRWTRIAALQSGRERLAAARPRGERVRDNSVVHDVAVPARSSGMGTVTLASPCDSGRAS